MFTMWLLMIGILLSSIFYIARSKKQKYLAEKLEVFSGPPTYPIIGNGHMVLGSMTCMIKRIMDCMDYYESPFRLWLLHVPVLVVYDPENFQIVSNNVLEKSMIYDFIGDATGKTVITIREIESTKYKRSRSAFSPAFNTTLLGGYFLNIFHETNELMIQELAEKAKSGEEFDLQRYVMKCFGRNILRTSMGYRFKNAGDEVKEEKAIWKHQDQVEIAMDRVVERIMRPWLHPKMLFDTYLRIKGDLKVFTEIRSFPKKVLKKKKEEIGCDEQDAINSCNNLNGRKAKNFMETLLSSEAFKYADDKELEDEILTFITTGSDTSIVAMCFTLLMLAMNPKIQEKVYEELREVLGHNNRQANMNDLVQLSLMERCIQETLRRFPPVPFIVRESTEDIELTGGRVLPAGTQVFLPIYMLHMNKRAYENPNEWNPDRFLPQEIAKRHPNSFVPFLTGPRTCIGSKYAMLAIKTGLAALLQSYKFTTNMKMNDIIIRSNLVMRNDGGFKVRIQRRN